MGAGCHYTNTLVGDKAAWIDYADSDEEMSADYIRETTLEDIAQILMDIGYKQDHNHNNIFRNGLFKLTLESKYYGDGLIFMFDAAHSEYGYYTGRIDPRYTLAKANLVRAERKVWKEMIKQGYKLFVATGGYTAEELILS
jgi:hypothetical protein